MLLAIRPRHMGSVLPMPTGFPMNKSLLLAAGAALLAAGCSTYQSVSPVENSRYGDPVGSRAAASDNHLCVVPGAATGSDFIQSFRASAEARGYQVTLLQPGSPIESCRLTAIYVATGQTVWRKFLSSADITVFRNGERVGKAIYNANRSSGGLNFSDLISPEEKLNELTAQLLPAVGNQRNNAQSAPQAGQPG
jgi:hypothetical protein